MELPKKIEANGQILLKTNGKTHEKIYVHSDVSKHLKTHQIDGIKFLFQNCFEENSGCILAHCMGLGKTLQVISMLHAVVNSKEFDTNRILILCPISTIMNWKEEIIRWLGPITDGHRRLQILELGQKDDIERKVSHLKNWSECDSQSPAVCLIMGYDAFRNLVNFHETKSNVKKYTKSSLKKIRDQIQKYLLDATDIVICDEGHTIKNNSSARTMAVHQIQTEKRIVLTGTPVQNHLMEYYSMVNFVRPNFLGTKQHFQEYFAQPISDGQHADSREADIKQMKECSYALNKRLSKIVQRREISLLKDFLPEKFEFVLFIPLTQVQYDLYKYFLAHRGGVIESKRLFGDFTCLRKIWTHLKVLDNAHQKSVAKNRQSTNNDDNGNSDEGDADEEYALSGALQMVNNDWWRTLIDKEELENAASSHKMIILFEILNECKRAGDKCVIFSAYVEVLNVVEHFMQQIDQRNGKSGLENFVGPWRKNEDYCRLDGSTPLYRRAKIITNFNDETNKRTKVMLVSSKAGGEGVNLFGANRLILLDTSWNPSTDQQCIFRIYRMGQNKQCYIYRLLSMGTMEEKIYSRSVTKQALSCRVVDKKQIDRHYTMNELHELYSLTKTDMKKRVVPVPPKDGILAHLLRKYPNMIFNYHEHDSLLANKEDEELNEREKTEAWQKCQKQNLQMQALNSLTLNGQETVMPFKLNNQPTLELKERSALKMGKRAVISQYDKENVAFGSNSESHVVKDHTSLQCSYKRFSSSNVTPVDTSNDLPKEHFEDCCDDSIEVQEPLSATMNQLSSASSEVEQEHPPTNAANPNDIEKGPFLAMENFEVNGTVGPGANGPILEIAEIVASIETPNDDSHGPSLLLLENCLNDCIEEPLSAILNRPSSASNEVEQEHSEDEFGSSSDDEPMDVQTLLQRSNSYEWLPPTSAANPNDFEKGPLLTMENFEVHDSVKPGAKGPILEIAETAAPIDKPNNDNHGPSLPLESCVNDCIEEPLSAILNRPSSASNEVEQEHSEDEFSSSSDDEQMDVQTSLQRSNSCEWLPPTNAANPNDFEKGPLLTMAEPGAKEPILEIEEIAASIDTPNADSHGPSLPLENCVNDCIEEPLSATINQLSSTSNEVEQEHSEDEFSSSSDDEQIDVQTLLQRSNSYEWLPPTNATDLPNNKQGPFLTMNIYENEAGEEPNDFLDHPLPESNRINLPSSTSNEAEHQNPEDGMSSSSDNEEMDEQLSRSDSYELLSNSNATVIESSSDAKQGPPLPPRNVNNVSNDSSNDDIIGPLEKIDNAYNENIDNDDEVGKGSLNLNAKELEHSVRDVQQRDAQLERSNSSVHVADSNGTLLIESTNDDSQRVVLTQKNVFSGSNDNTESIDERSPLLVKNDCWRDNGSVSTDNHLVHSPTYLSKSYQCPADSITNSIDDVRGVRPPENVDSSNCDIHELPLNNGNQDDMERTVERSMSDFVKSLLHALNKKYSASEPQPYSMEDYEMEEEIIRPNEMNNLEYRIALKRPSNGAIPRPIKRLKLSLEIDPMEATTVRHCLNAIMGKPQSLNADIDHVRSSNLNGEEHSKELATDVQTTESAEICSNVDVKSDEIIVKTDSSDEQESDSVQDEIAFPVDIEADEEMSSNESAEPIELENDDPLGDEFMPSCEYMDQTDTQSEGDRDSSAGMTESESSDAEDLDDVHIYEEQPSTMSRIRESCALM